MKLARKDLAAILLLLGVSLLLPSAFYGQSGILVKGQIADPSTAGIPGATVTLFSDDRVRTTKADAEGRFVFTDAAGPRFLEATSAGFRSSSIRVPDNPTEQVLLSLQVGSCTQCGLGDMRDRSVHYEERSGREQVTGTVAEFAGLEFWGPLLANVPLRLLKANLNAPETGSWPSNYNPPMNWRVFQYSVAAQPYTNEKGEFQFADLEPGWYSLEVNHVGYWQETRKFWIARETLTRPSLIELVRSGGASPMGPPQQFPLTPAKLGEIPLIPPKQ